MTTWWCIAHRTNLALGDVLKENKEFIQFLRLLVAYTHNSAHKGQVNEKYVAILDLAEKMTALSASLDLKLANADPNDPDNDAEIKRIFEGKERMQDYTNSMRRLPKDSWKETKTQKLSHGSVALAV